MNKKLIQLEGMIVMILGIYIYFASGYSWWIFLLLLFVPDIFMAGYMFGSKAGAYLYNVSHTFIAPLLLLLVSMMFSMDSLLMVGLIWMVHIGMDRMMGYGLKYKTHFKDTHIQRL